MKVFALSFFQILALCVSDRMILLLSIEKIFHFEISKGFLKLDLFLDLRAMWDGKWDYMVVPHRTNKKIQFQRKIGRVPLIG